MILLVFSAGILQPCLAHYISHEARNLNATPNNTAHSEALQGWTSSPDIRGTLDIIWSSVFTIFLCAWTSLCVQVPALGEDEWVLQRRKLYLFVLGIAGPEFTLLLALGQFISARRSFKAFQASGHRTWTMSHSFFADMGGFLLRSPDMPLFPIDALQLHYLVTNSYIEYPGSSLDKRAIGDRNKTDALVRVITVFQTLWFTINCIARVIQKLALTTLELTALAFILCTLTTTFCWAHKPADVSNPLILETKTPISAILLSAGDAAALPYRNTPLDFISRREWSWSLYWQFWRAMMRWFRVVFYPRVRPINRFPNDNFPETGPWGLLAYFFLTIAYAAIFLAGWNFTFPTRIERDLWRIASIGTMLTIILTWIVDTTVFRIFPGMRENAGRNNTGSFYNKSPSRDNDKDRHGTWFGRTFPGKTILRAAQHLRNTSPDKDPAYTVPLRALVPVTLSAIMYLAFRAYLVGEDFAGLRAMPKSAYQVVDWPAFIPHI